MRLIKKKGSVYLIDCLEYGLNISKYTLVLKQGKDGLFRLVLFSRKQYEDVEYVPELIISNDQCANFKVCYSIHGSVLLIFKSPEGELKSITLFECKSYTVEDHHLIVNKLMDTNAMIVAPNKLKVRIPIKNNL
jgi:hypothetical protein